MRRALFVVAATLALHLAPAAFAQGNESDSLRATQQVGEQADGYLGFVEGRTVEALKPRVDQVNIQRRAYYTQLAEQRGQTVETVARITACVLAGSVDEGEYWRGEDGRWVRRAGAAIVNPSPLCARGS